MVRLERPPSLNSSSSPTTPRPKAIPPAPSLGRRASRNGKDDNGVSGRVRVAVRLRPRNSEELKNDADFADYVELMPELKRLKLRKNNWDCETFQFDEILNETASQKRVYEVVAKPVVESVLEGYNGTVMAYGQTGTGKTFTLGKLGEEDAADRGIMVRAMEDILADTSSEQGSITVSYLQLYMETVQDLLAPEKDNLTIAEDPRTGDVSLPGATSVEVRDPKSFLELLEAGEANRIAANTKMNTESSRSHALLLVNVKKSVRVKQDKDMTVPNENGASLQISKAHNVPTIRKSKLLIVDLAGSERVDKSGSEGHLLEEAKFINLSLTALGKCINALAENSPHVPIRDSKLTRLLRDSFGGSARTSLIITIGPSPQHRAETMSTILFGQRAMKVENMVKLREEFDYKSLCRKLEADLDRLIAENERQNKVVLDAEEQLQRGMEEAELTVQQAERRAKTLLEESTAERVRLQKENMERIRRLQQECSQLEKELTENAHKLRSEKEVAVLEKEMHLQTERDRKHKEMEEWMQEHQLKLAEVAGKFEAERVQREAVERRLQELEDGTKARSKLELEDQEHLHQLSRKMEEESRLREEAVKELGEWKSQRSAVNIKESAGLKEEVKFLRQEVEEQLKQRELLEREVKDLKQHLLQLSYDADETKKFLEREPSKISLGSESPMSLSKPHHMRETINGQRATIAKLFEQVGLHRILSLLESEDIDVRVHAVKVVANLAAEESNQEKIVESGGIGSLLRLLDSSEDETIRRVAAGAVANLAMTETNQELIMAQNGIKLLSRTANEADDPQTLRMVAGAIANLCGNEKLQRKLREDGGIKALLGMARLRHPDVLAQIARGVANFAKCESRAAAQGHKREKSLLIEDGALPWVVTNAGNEVSPVRRHIELALCHLAQHEVNTADLIAAGALWELVRISKECSREDIRVLARKTITASPTFQAELRRGQTSQVYQ
ncbi:hypothetical protein GOP47_0018408 [Adiantum capillus-veneris]|uniref:Kinesin-like protein n=1 Tax=Adiantum capillus-veneris TaxID=13818 RepID=A0A9D4Z8Q9_ADICA|nr:hypothetical protein GOP47_0018408 [Adiantum capillus-veneris]